MNTAPCPHLHLISALSKPRPPQEVHREECTQCFDNQDGELGIDICLSCYNGGCLSKYRHHAITHNQKSAHPFSLNIKRRRKPVVPRTDDEPPLKKLAILVENEADKYLYETTLRCWGCGGDQGRELRDAKTASMIKPLSDAILAYASSGRQSTVKAWEEEIHVCEHALTISSDPDPMKIPISSHCADCELKENLWLCLSCGNVGCGRQQYGGLDGHGHGLAHFEASGRTHAIAVKLGTITPEGEADAYCYTDGDSVLDPLLSTHLQALGLNVASATKTVQSTTELQIKQNLAYEFSLLSSTGENLKPVFGPGLTGLQNLGNSCYMASTLQVLFALPRFRRRYLPTAELHSMICPLPLPADCVDCQLHKLADGLLSGRYSVPRREPDPAVVIQPQENDPVFQEGLRPIGFKSLVGKGHHEFATMRQQDAEEFLGHLLQVLRAHHRKMTGGASLDDSVNDEPTEIFRFGVEERLHCYNCGKVRYRTDETDTGSLPVPAREVPEDGARDEAKKYAPVQLLDCLQMWMGNEPLDYKCPACGEDAITKQTRFASFPNTLVLHARKFQLVNWVPTKLDVPLILPPHDILVLDYFLGDGLQDDEELLPDDTAGSSEAAPSLPEFNPEAIAQLEGMGFPLVRCQKALLATGGANATAEDIDEPIVLTSRSGGAAAAKLEPSSDQIEMLADMGFTFAQARKALMETDGNPERAVEWLFSHPDDTGEEPAGAPGASSAAPPAAKKLPGSTALPARFRLKAFISHKGPSVHSGHYVAHIRSEVGDWVLFNDEKVVEADAESVEELKKLAYLYIFERI